MAFNMGRGGYRPKAEDYWATELWIWIHTQTQLFADPTASS